MPTSYATDSALPARSCVLTRQRLLLTLLALGISAATACGERAAPPAIAPAPAAAPGNHETVHPGTPVDTQVHQDVHASHAPTSATASVPLLPVTPWPSDPPLREGMRRMHRAVEALGHAEHDHLDAAQATAAAHQVQAAAEVMIANCKLAPEPDAALHGLLATLLKGAAAIKADPANTAPVAAMRDAMALYPRMFADAAWQADTAPAE